jgi:hypothetical protein
LSLGGWSPLLPTNSPGFVVLRRLTSSARACRYGTLTRCGVAFQRLRVGGACCVCQSLQPRCVRKHNGLGCSRFARHYSGNLMLMSSRRATEMFQFARGPPHCLSIQQWVSRHDSGWVAPFGSSGLLARMQLPLNVSPVSASFFGLQRRGIHLVLSRACLTVRSLTTPHTLKTYLAWLRLQTTHSSSTLFSLSSRSFSALGKIEVIILYHISAMQL